MIENIQPKILKRAFATIVDYGIFYALIFFLINQFGVISDDGSKSIKGIEALIIPVYWFLYFPVCEYRFSSTLGKLPFGLKVFSEDGKQITFLQALKRRIIDPIDLFTYGIVAFLAVKFSQNHQRLGDMFANTIVIGGEALRCINCNTKLSIEANEIIDNSYTCPECEYNGKVKA